MRVIVMVLALFLVLAGCQVPVDRSQPAFSSHSSSEGEWIFLPGPTEKGGASLDEALAKRRSIRSFQDRELSWEQVSQLLWAAQGITSSDGKRTAPSAGGLYPLDLYYFWSSGWGRYDPVKNVLQVMGEEDRRQDLAHAALEQQALREAPGIFLILANVERSATRYGERAQRYAILEAGHVCQNLLLEVVSLRLGAVPVGAFEDEEVLRVVGAFGLPLYLVPVGYPGDQS